MCTGVQEGGEGKKKCLEGSQETTGGYLWGPKLEREPVEKETSSFYFLSFHVVRGFLFFFFGSKSFAFII